MRSSAGQGPPLLHWRQESKTLEKRTDELPRQLGVPTNRVTGILNGQNS